MTEIKCPIREAALISGVEPALITSQSAVKYAEMDQLVAATASALAGRGIQEGERVALCMSNRWEFAVLYFALLRIGAVSCPLSTRLPPRGLFDQIEALGCVALITEDGEADDVLPDSVQVISASQTVVMFSPNPDIQVKRKLTIQQPATIVCTSGSSGPSKAVLHTLGNHYYSALGANQNLHLRSHDTWLLSLPLYHVGGLGILFRCFQVGAAVHFMDEGEDLLAAMERCRPSHVSVVATQLHRLMRSQEGDWDAARNPRVILLGGGPTPEPLLDEALRRHWPVYQTYGLTEMSSQITAVPEVCPPNARRTAGQLLRHRELRLAPDGEILVRGRTRFAGYVSRAGLKEPFDDEGWFATGDLGEFDAANCLIVRGRKDNQFISGGENIQPEEIEAVLTSAPGVEAALVVPVKNEEFGQRPVAYVKAETLDGLEAYVSERLPGFKVPDTFYPWPEDAAIGIKPSRAAFRRLAQRGTG